MSEQQRVGVVGVGRMGANMARRLKDVGYPVVAVYDVRPDAARELAAELGAEAASSLARVTVLTVPATLGLVLLGGEVVRIVMQSGSFSRADTERVASDDLAYIPFTYPFNISGQPAISLPLGWSPEGLPIGVQIVGRPYGEALIISLAAQIERAAPWANRYPAAMRG